MTVTLCVWVLIMLSWVGLWVWPTHFLHPVLAWHRLVLKHTWDVEPCDFADWDIECSCGKRAVL